MEVMENKEPSISPFSSAAGLTQILEDLINSPQQQQDLQEADYNGAKVEDISDKVSSCVESYLAVLNVYVFFLEFL